MVDAYFCPNAFFGTESIFLQNFSKNKTSNEGGERSYIKCCYFNQSNVNLHHQIFQGLTEAVGLMSQVPTFVLGETSYSSQDTRLH